MKKYHYKDYEFEVVEFSEKFDIYCQSEFKEWLKLDKWKSFISFQEALLDEILDLGFNIDGKFNIMIATKGDEFKEITKTPYESGICDAILGDDVFLVFDDLIAENFICENIPSSKKKMIIHEWAHMVVYKYNNKLTHTLNEGLADLIPLYILNYQDEMPEYVEKLKALNKESLVSVDYIDEYDVLDDNLQETAQNKHTYLSCYLFILNIMKNIEVKYDLDKLKALKFFLTLMRVHNKHHYEVIAEILDLSLEKLKFNDFQLEALEHI